MLDNKRSKENVKDILFFSKIYTFDFYPRYGHELRISSESVSLKMGSYHTGLCCRTWSYISDSPLFVGAYEKLLEEVFALFESKGKPQLERRLTDIKTRINYKDGTFEEMYLMGNLVENGFAELAKAGRWFLPKTETAVPAAFFGCPIPHMQRPFTNEEEEKIDLNHICAIYFDGDGREFFAFDDRCFIYSIDPGILSEEEILHQPDLIQFFFDGYPPFPMNSFHGTGEVEVFGQRWIYVYLGMANQLYMRADFYDEHIEEIYDANVIAMFHNWRRLARLR